MREHLATLVDDFRRYGRNIAVVRHQGNRRRATTYAELAALAGRFAALLERRGVVEGDRVLLWAENSAEWLAAFHGCLRRGALVVPLDANGSLDFAARVAADVSPKLAVGDALLLDELKRVRPEIPQVRIEDWATELPAEEATPVAGLSHKTPLQILFTSGTTGDPKGIVITHGNVLASVGPIEDASQKYLRYEKLIHPLRILHTLPLSHVFGQTMGLWIPQIYTAELHFEDRLAAPRLIELVRRERISVLATVPRVLSVLKAHLETTDPALAARLEQSKGGQTSKGGETSKGIRAWQRWWRFRAVHRAFGFKFWAFVSGGGALSGPLEQFWNGLGFVLVQGYGMTETTALITLNHPFHVAKGTIGKPLAGREVKLGPDGEVLVKGAMISGATWQGGKLQQRDEEWLATGDLAEVQPSGELKFVGRKSEVIVTASGVNLHPEDMEAAVEVQPGVAGCAVVGIETAAGPEACAVLAVRGAGEQAGAAVEAANAKLAEYQRIRRWVLYPEPDLPRTSTGKVKRKEVAAWLRRIEAAKSGGSQQAFGASSDWLIALIAQITGENYRSVGDEQRLTEDLHLDSLGRVQLAAALEERLGVVSSSGLLEEAETLGDLRRLAGEDREQGSEGARERGDREQRTENRDQRTEIRDQFNAVQKRRYVYPLWPWWKLVEWIRIAFVEAGMRPLVWLLANPRVYGPAKPLPIGPMLIVGNHVTTYDGPLIEYALEGRIRRHIAVAMSADMLDDLRHWRDPEKPRGMQGFYLFGPPAYFLITALFNVFPLPRLRDFQTSFAHAGRAMDRGMNVMVFPEGTRSAEGTLARFRAGIGLLAKQSGVPVLPVAIRGLGELKAGNKRWFRSGRLEVHVGDAISFSPEATEGEITERLHAEVEKLLKDSQ
jgi:long-chain acyl-CoA synthetase